MPDAFVDIHHHILYGLDDGPNVSEQSMDMLKWASQDGITRIFATSHACPGQAVFDLTKYRDRLNEARAYVVQQALPLELLPGAEIFYSDATLRFLEQGRVPTLAGGRHVLIEFAPDAPFETIYDAVRKLANATYIPILAHIERYACLDLAHTRQLREQLGALMQVNCSSILSSTQPFRGRTIRALLNAQLVDFVATDAHNLTTRRTRMGECYSLLKKTYGACYARALTQGNQALIFPSEA